MLKLPNKLKFKPTYKLTYKLNLHANLHINLHYFLGGGMSIFEPESLAIFAGNTQKYSLINCSKIAQKVLDI